MLVFSMGLLMIGGTLLLAGAVWKKVSHEGRAAAASSACAGGAVDLRGRGQVMRAEREGGLLYLTLQKSGQALEVATVNLCTGEVKSAVPVTVDGVKATVFP